MAELSSGATAYSPAVSGVLATAQATRSVEHVEERKRREKNEHRRASRLLEASAQEPRRDPADPKAEKGATIDLRI